MSCQFKNECPSYSGWCEAPKQDFSRCIPFLISAVNTARNSAEKMSDGPKIVYECDRKACKKCVPDCHLTFDIFHAVNFQMTFSGVMVEGGDNNGI